MQPSKGEDSPETCYRMSWSKCRINAFEETGIPGSRGNAGQIL